MNKTKLQKITTIILKNISKSEIKFKIYIEPNVSSKYQKGENKRIILNTSKYLQN